MIARLLHVVVWTIAACRRIRHTLKRPRSAQKSWPGFAFSTLERSGQKEVAVKQFEKHLE